MSDPRRDVRAYDESSPNSVRRIRDGRFPRRLWCAISRCCSRTSNGWRTGRATPVSHYGPREVPQIGLRRRAPTGGRGRRARFRQVERSEAVVQRLRTEENQSMISVLLTSPLVGRHSAERAAALAAQCDLIVAIDHCDGVDELEAAAVAAQSTLSVLCDVDVGLGRTGVVGPAEALAVAERVNVATCLEFRGVQGYGGHLQHISGREHRREATIASTKCLSLVIDALESAGYHVAIRSGGGTGTMGLDAEIGVLNELQTGSYVFMDREYRDALGEDPEGRFVQSLTLITTVISANHEGYVTVDAGLKAMATDAGVPLVVGHETSATYQFFGDEQGMVTCAPGHSFRRGERLELVPPHCDPTVDRYDVIWLVHDDVVVDVIDVTARGRSQ